MKRRNNLDKQFLNLVSDVLNLSCQLTGFVGKDAAADDGA